MNLKPFDKAAILFKDGRIKSCYIIGVNLYGNGMIKVAFKIPVSYKVLSYPNGGWEVVLPPGGRGRQYWGSRPFFGADKRYTAKFRVEVGYSFKASPSILFLPGEF
jgi:hypothetical protein